MRMVAVDATYFGRAPRLTRRVSRPASYNPATEPKGPVMRWSSSWMISSGGRDRVVMPKKAPVRSSQASRANLSIVPISRDGGRS